MNEPFLTSSYLTGNYRPHEKIKDIKGCTIEKHNGSMFIKENGKNIQISPVDQFDESTAIVTREFSEEGYSIYRLKTLNDTIVILLYTFQEIKTLLTSSMKMVIHLLSNDELKMCSEEGLIKNLRVKNKNDIANKLKETFIYNNSIFITPDKEDPDQYQMYGKNCSARVKMERGGIYVITSIHRDVSKKTIPEITQIYGSPGNITFELSEDARKEKGNDPSIFFNNTTKTSEIFKAWDQYMDYQKVSWEEDLGNCIIPFTDMRVSDDEVIFTIPSNIDASSFMDEEFEYISIKHVKEGSKLPECACEICEFKDTRGNEYPIFVDKIAEYSRKNHQLHFKYPDREIPDHLKTGHGVLYRSDKSLRIELRRRNKVISTINSKSNPTANILMDLSDPNVVNYDIGTSKNPVSSNMLKQMFKTKDIKLNENYRDAINVALNTPDIALIKGPPGTGKTTLINGIVAKLNEEDKNIHILISSEQHEALDNAVTKVAKRNSLPPFVTSHNKNSEEDDKRFEDKVYEFQKRITETCNSIINTSQINESYSDNLATIVSLIQRIRDSNYSTVFINDNLENLQKILLKLDCAKETSELMLNLKLTCTSQKISRDIDPSTKLLIRKIESQRIDITSFNDDGSIQLQNLQDTLENHGYKDILLDKNIFESLISGDQNKIISVFDEYVNYINNLKNMFTPGDKSLFESEYVSAETMINLIESIVFEKSKTREMTYIDIIEHFSYMLRDTVNASEVIRKYTPVIGSTAAQAENSSKYVKLPQNMYNYVIIDEAARANPVDIMIPLMMGARVLLVGDHNQLPHYIESDVINRIRNNKKLYSQFDEKLLTSSLFQIIYDNLEKANNSGRLAVRRTAMLTEQHRMHPIIGNFISHEFYNDELTNASETEGNENNFNVLDNKNVAYIHVPSEKGQEELINKSYVRLCELPVVLDLIKDIISKNPNNTPSIGIMSFYNGQVEALKSMIDENISDSVAKIECGTVDSYQGKEFDIVIISGTRCNPKNRLGFLQDSPSRINVAFSRAKKLLVFIGDKETYSGNDNFKHFFEYVESNGYVGQ